MSGIENILPTDHQFNESVRILRDELIDQFTDETESSGDILNAEREFSRSPVRIWQLSGALAGLLKSEDETESEVQGALYRGVTFGLQLADVVMDGPLESISLETWMNDDRSVSPQELGEAICVDVQTYLAERPDIDSLLAYFMPEVSGRNYDMHHHHIETGAGLMLLLCERQQAEAYLQARTESITQDDILGETRYNGSDI